jgi:rhamnosyltransferase|tara:strand:- start:170 stop:1543 length:1374 start_codon:yes stop_codon:yes gene_type:complete
MKKIAEKISIIIRTKNEERWIEQCLKKIFDQNYDNFEVILVDNNSKDKTLEKAKKFPVKVIKINKFLPGKAINLGIKKSTGKIIVCLSAHCIPINNNWLKKIIFALKDPNVAGVYGRQKPLSYSSDFDKRDLFNLFGPEKKIQRKDTFFHNANSAFKKKLWSKIPFDEKTKHIEDRIWGNQVINKGYKIIYEPNAPVYHWHGINQDMEPSRCKRIVNILESLNQDFKSNILENEINPNCVAIIPLRGETLRIDNKLSLLDVTVSHLKKSKLIKDIYLATDNKKSKKIGLDANIKVPFLRPKYLSDTFIDIKSILTFFLDRLEKKKTIDIVVVATENFPLRNSNIFDKMINKLIKNNFDTVIACKEEKGSIFIKKDNKLNKINDGEVPFNLRSQDAFTSRIGIAYVTRASSLRKEGNLLSSRLGYYYIDNTLEITEINNKNLSKYIKEFIKITYSNNK